MTVEPYAFYFMGRNSSVTFSAITAPESPRGVSATGANSYYYNSHSYVEQKVYLPGVWCKYYYHCAIPLIFQGS